MENRYTAKWASLETTSPPPSGFRNLIIMEFEEFQEKIFAQEPNFVGNLLESLYDGDFYLLKRAFPKNFLEELKTKTIEYGQQNPSTYHPMLEGCPDFQRIIDHEASKLYTYTAIRRSHFFFPWNNDPLDCFDAVNKCWRIFKFISGLPIDAYEKNTPKDGVVDRIQVALYPAGGGGLASHTDSTKNQKVIIGAMMSKRGEDFQAGGFFCVDCDGKKVDFEDHIEVGDFVCGYPTVVHGVVSVDPSEPVDWPSFKGRWFLGLYSNDSNHVKNRNTTQRIPEEGRIEVPLTF